MARPGTWNGSCPRATRTHTRSASGTPGAGEYSPGQQSPHLPARGRDADARPRGRHPLGECGAHGRCREGRSDTRAAPACAPRAHAVLHVLARRGEPRIPVNGRRAVLPSRTARQRCGGIGSLKRSYVMAVLYPFASLRSHRTAATHAVHLISSAVQVVWPTVHVVSPTVHVVWPTVHVVWPTVHVTWPGVHVVSPAVHVTWPTVHVTWPGVHVTWPAVHVVSPTIHVVSPAVHVTWPAVQGVLPR